MKRSLVWIRTGSLIISLGILIAVTTYSWFNFRTSAGTDELSADVIGMRSNNTLIAYRSSDDWGSSIDIPNVSTVTLKPMVGDGVSFYQQGRKKITNEDGTYDIWVKDESALLEVTEDTEAYISFDFKIKNDYAANLYLDENSYLNPASLQEDASIEEAADYGAGAVRVCVSKLVEGSYQPLFVWIPNSRYERSGSYEGGYTYQKDGSAESTYTFYQGAENITTVESKSLPAGRTKLNGIWYFWGDLEEIEELGSSLLTGFQANKEENFRLTIWLDGSDRECTNAVIGGAITVGLSFQTVITETN